MYILNFGCKIAECNKDSEILSESGQKLHRLKKLSSEWTFTFNFKE